MLNASNAAYLNKVIVMELGLNHTCPHSSPHSNKMKGYINFTCNWQAFYADSETEMYLKY